MATPNRSLLMLHRPDFHWHRPDPAGTARCRRCDMTAT